MLHLSRQRGALLSPWGQGVCWWWDWRVPGRTRWGWRRPRWEQHDGGWQSPLPGSGHHGCADRVGVGSDQRSPVNGSSWYGSLPEPAVHPSHWSQSQTVDVDPRGGVLRAQTADPDPQADAGLWSSRSLSQHGVFSSGEEAALSQLTFIQGHLHDDAVLWTQTRSRNLAQTTTPKDVTICWAWGRGHACVGIRVGGARAAREGGGGTWREAGTAQASPDGEGHHPFFELLTEEEEMKMTNTESGLLENVVNTDAFWHL